jgi:proteasome accessory factor B
LSTHSTISRYLIILKRLKAKPYTSFEELNHTLKREFEFLQAKDDMVELAFSKRTFQREIKAIRKLFDINIEYSKKEKGYYIVPNEMENTNFLRMMEAFNMFQSLNMAQDLEPFIHLEKRRPQGTDNLYGLLHAIKNKLQVTFTYHKYWDDEISERTAEPYALKEFEQRWYLLCMDFDKKAIRTFALDRITELDISRTTFRFPKQFNIEAYFKNYFGIITTISGDEEAPQEIILSFTENQGKYVKSLPLHHSQQILLDTEAGLQIKLQVCVTHDLIMKLLSFGSEVKVLQPQSLIVAIKEIYKDALKRYTNL